MALTNAERIGKALPLLNAVKMAADMLPAEGRKFAH